MGVVSLNPEAYTWSLRTQVCGWSASYAVERRNFHGPQCDTAWLFLTEFFLSDPMYGIHRQPPGWLRYCQSSVLSWGTADTASSFASWSVWPDFPLYGDEFSISLNSAIFFCIYCRASYIRVRPLTSCRRFPHTSGLPLDSCVLANSYQTFLPHFHAKWREKKFSHFNWTLKWFFFRNRANYFHPGANMVRSHGSRDS